MTNLTKRIIPCLDIKDGRVVKGVNFVGLKDAGNPIDVAKKYNESGADELVFLDITASHENRKATLKIIESISRDVFIPLTVGGGISTLQDILDLLNAGCDKVSINSSALKNPDFINEATFKFGSQCVVVAVDAKERSDGSIGVFTHGGRSDSSKDMQEWLKEVQNRGAGEILLTSMDTDGTKNGFDMQKLRIAMQCCSLPIIASGGAGSMEHILEAFKGGVREDKRKSEDNRVSESNKTLKGDVICESGVDATLAASIFHYGEIDIMDLKRYLRQNGIKVRI